MPVIYPNDGQVLKNKINGVFSFMANTAKPENWENVDLSEYEDWKRTHPAEEDATAEDYEQALADLGVRV